MGQIEIADRLDGGRSPLLIIIATLIFEMLVAPAFPC